MKTSKRKILSMLLMLTIVFSSISVTSATEILVENVPTDIQIIEVSENVSEQEIDHFGTVVRNVVLN
ncbi:hypothetical protein [Sinanaerobacter sp. ZZT-01]|uniref:hypothetical protein n=1 Tax=Sinanaerobacter sp. ZZT-01 TaxID=3111540 RepID=UPI002D790395|nr:hypothetical protein [Sinanaerobacter sp. ZZT-01]WRR92516.1 hypothetical protein U5921_10685 [Sinanaerobacter sp. ZZT-01]